MSSANTIPAETRGVLRRLIDRNVKVSDQVHRIVDRKITRTRGWTDFVTRVIPGALQPGLRVLDVGSGKRPQIDAHTRARLDLHVVGLDIDSGELALAPAGAYDENRVGDIAVAALGGPYDLILSCAVLEHVVDTEAAITNMASALAPAGRMLHYIPGAWAPFAAVNRALGPKLSRALLFALYPEKRASQGFPAYYRHCTPSAMERLMKSAGLEDVVAHPYYASDYFRAFAPAYVLELARQVAVQSLQLRDFSESFFITARAPLSRAAASQRPARTG